MNTIDQTIIVEKILKELNFAGIPTSKVEAELPISSGYLYKAKMGIKTLAPDTMKKLQDYHAKKIKKDQAPVIKIPAKVIIKPVTPKEDQKSEVSKKVSLASYLGHRPNEKFSKKIR